ncbi:MAG: UDP-N-acetylglucosamine 1-carboxyvinyltransferase [Lentisphaerae bacterium]|nr:UDP-N-acetylglucosamine 1-carboxyvinyltransferase [Lentisphaerota bacterium]
MPSLIIQGKQPLGGTIRVGGNKNAVLPMIASLMLTDEPCVLHNVPDILDVRTMLDIARHLGAEAELKGNTLYFQCKDVIRTEVDKELCARNRTSILFAGPMLARCGRIALGRPGGDSIGRRRLDGHFYGLENLGARFSEDSCFRFTRLGKRLLGRELFLDEPSVTATEQIISAAVTAEGITTLYNAASEPHVTDLGEMLNKMGAKISGLGSNILTIEGVEKLHGVEHEVIFDHINAGSFVALAAATGADLTIEGVRPRSFWMLRRVYERLGINVGLYDNHITVSSEQSRQIKYDAGGPFLQISDGPWPQFPTDMMSCTIVAATQCRGTVTFFEKMFDGRMNFVDRLIDMRANAIICDPHRVVITGPSELRGTELASPDIRAGMALVIAALCAKGESRIRRAEIIYRGYGNLVEKLRSIGACVEEVE